MPKHYFRSGLPVTRARFRSRVRGGQLLDVAVAVGDAGVAAWTALALRDLVVAARPTAHTQHYRCALPATSTPEVV
jgi:hypothetical protein